MRYAPAKHRYLATVGDINPAEYGGGWVLRILPNGGRDSSYLAIEVVEWDSDEDDATGYLFRANVEHDVAKYHDWIDVNKVVSSLGYMPGDGPTTADEWRAMARSRNPLDRARCLEDIAGYYGWTELDNYPERVSRAEVRKRWARARGPRRTR